MSTHWITGDNGRYGFVDDDEQLQTWTVLYGWHETVEPGPLGQTYVRNPAQNLTGCIPFGALASGWAESGWEPGPPPIPTDPTRPKEPPAQPPPEEFAAPVAPEPPTKAGGAGTIKEK